MNRAEKRRQQKMAKKSAGRAPNHHSIASGQTLGLALQHHRAGRLSEAASLYRQVLQADPDQPDALHLLGVIASQEGKHDIAVDLISKALAINPGFAEAHTNLGAALKGLGKLEEAVASYHKALTINPNYAEAHSNLGNALKDLGKLEEAAESYHKAITLNPGFAEAHSNLGTALKGIGMLDAAVASLHKAITINPNYAEAHSNLGNALKEQGKFDEAVASFHKAITLNPNYAEAHSNLGTALKDLRKLDEAVACHRKAITINPNYAEAHTNLGNALTDQGKLEEAAASFRNALAIKPDYAEAHRHLSQVKKYSEYDEDVRSMEDVYAKSGINSEERMHLAFGLGKAFEGLKQYDKAFDYLATGNAIKRGTYSYSTEDDVRSLEQQKSVFSPSLFSTHKQGGCQDNTPIFIVGMPRSGTTLVEQILASHPDVYGAGELSTLGNITTKFLRDKKYPDGVEDFTDADYTKLGTEYIREIRKHSGHAQFITDKMPDNRHFLGIIKLALPNAKVIHCKRNPIDNGLSLFKALFPIKGHFYAYDLREIGEYFNIYSDLMEHWHRVMPGFIHDNQYEDMVTNQIEQTRALLEFCGLEWDDACLEFYKSDRPVATASATQVRKPIYNSSVQFWKRYEKKLAPMLESLRGS